MYSADIVPLTCIAIDRLFVQNEMKSLLINTIHDSVLVDVHPSEEQKVISLVKEGAGKVIPMMKEYYDIDFNVPLDNDVKIGYDWLDMEEV